MLTIEQGPVRAREKLCRITIPAEMSYDDRLRLRSLATLCFGHSVQKPESYVFTEVRGRKCWLLFQAGFEAIGGFTKSHQNKPLRHPDCDRPLALHEAVNIAKIVVSGRAA